MRRSVVQLTFLMVVAVLVGSFGVQGAWALWGVQTPSTAGTIHAADFRVDLNGQSMIGDDGLSATVQLGQLTGLTPTSPIHANVTVANATNASAPFGIETVLGAATITGANTALSGALKVQSAVAPSGGSECAAAHFSNASTIRIPKGASATFCVRVSLPSDASPTLQGQTATITLPVTASQLPQGA